MARPAAPSVLPESSSLTLLIDTAQDCRVGLFAGDQLLLWLEEDVGKHHETHLLPLIDRALLQAGKQFADLTQIAVVAGQGAFTSLRVGVATAKALAFGLNLPLSFPSCGGVPEGTTPSGFACHPSDEGN